MGMDVYGTNPTDTVGEYFRANVWWWHPLADYCLTAHQDLTEGCIHWHSNDGDGLDAAQATRLADALDADLESGRVAAWVEVRDTMLAALPNLTCHLCNGSGVRTDEIGHRFGYDVPRDPETGRGGCNGCGGRGENEHPERSYPFDADIVARFAAFIRHSGGFEIC